MIRRVECTAATYRRLENIQNRLGLNTLADALGIAVWAYHDYSVRTPLKVGKHVVQIQLPKRKPQSKFRKGSLAEEIGRRPLDSRFTPYEFVTETRSIDTVMRALNRLRDRGFLCCVIPPRPGRPSVWTFNAEWHGHPETKSKETEIQPAFARGQNQDGMANGGLGLDPASVPAPARDPALDPAPAPARDPAPGAGAGPATTADG